MGSELHLTFSKRDYDSDALKKELSREVAAIERYAEWVRKDIDQYNASLKSKLLARLKERKGKLLKNQGLVSSLGIPIRQRKDAPLTYSIPFKRKRIPIPKPSANEATFAPEPELAHEIYEQILNILRSMVLVMERSPSAFSNMGEEDLRTHFLVQLNGQYEGQATGETFK